jgi:cytochrome c peroxidase
MHRIVWKSLAVVAWSLTLAACDEPRPTAPPATEPSLSQNGSGGDVDAIIREVRQLAATRGIGPLPAPSRIRQPLVLLGRLLAFDPILSGGRDIACMTCHVPGFATGDAKSLSVGQGGFGLGPGRSHPGGVFIPRNAPPLFNLGALRRLFWDGRVEVNISGQLRTPAGSQITPEMAGVMELGAVSAVGLFPVTNRAEMRGLTGNELAAIPDADLTAIWKGLMARLGSIPEYRALFEAAYPGTRFDAMTFAHASNAIGAFLVDQLTLTNAPWDRFLAGDDAALTPKQLEGAKTFLGLRCVQCHNGPTFSDQEFHNVAVAQVGPGQGNGPGGLDDFGRMNVSGGEADRYRFRTTPLRNVELTAPYGHSGSIVGLRAFIEHYSESHLKLLEFDPGQLEPALRGTLVPNAVDVIARRDPILDGVVLPAEIVDKLMDYMSALTDDAARTLKHVAPQRVPSGLRIGVRVE